MRNSNFIKRAKNDKRTPEQIREHYEIERELADKLRKASREERRHLYTTLYDELFRRVPHHPQLTHKKNLAFQQAVVSVRMELLKRFLYPEATFLEVGPGDCALSLEVAQHVKKVYAIDVSEDITQKELFPQNFELIISDGCSIPVPKNSINVAYSDQLMEHLHPDDAHEELQNIYKALSPEGIYICITPNRLNGPHDVSKYFDNIATGFHIKEYTVTELCDLFYKAGFSKVKVYINIRMFYVNFFLLPITLCEKFLYHVRLPLRRTIANSFMLRKLLNGILIAKKKR